MLMTQVLTPTMFYDTARVFLDYPRDTQNLIADEGSAKPMAQPLVDRTASGYASASAAVLAYFDALIVEELAKEKGASPDEVRCRIALQEPEYYLARSANGLSEHARPDDKGDAAKLMRPATPDHLRLPHGRQPAETC